MSDNERNTPLPDADAATRLAALRRGVASGQSKVNPHVDPNADAMLAALQSALATGNLAALASEVGIIGRGGLSRDQRVAREDRDFLIRRIHLDLGLKDRGTAAAAQVIQRFKRYEATGWKRDRNRDDPPADPIKALCWNILKLDLPDRSRMPSPETVSEILKKVHSGV